MAITLRKKFPLNTKEKLELFPKTERLYGNNDNGKYHIPSENPVLDPIGSCTRSYIGSYQEQDLRITSRILLRILKFRIQDPV